MTGRLSSSNPNLQNIPIRTEEGRRVRNGFIAAKGNLLLSVDYSQIELRIVAHMAKDEAMLAAFRAGQDIHATTAAAIYNLPLEQVTKEMRRHAKAINFGLIYGMSAFGLTRTTELTLAEAEEFVKAYFKQFPGVKKYLDGIRKQAAAGRLCRNPVRAPPLFPGPAGQTKRRVQEPGGTRSHQRPHSRYGRRYHEDRHAAYPARFEESRTACPDAACKSMTNWFWKFHKEELEKTARVVREVMGSAYPLDIPLSTEARSGMNWGEMKVMEA